MRGIVVGLGGRARSWIEVARRQPQVELVGFVEPATAQREAAVAAGVAAETIFGELHEALHHLEADFVIDVTPPKAHEEVALMAFDHGLDVLGEKPMSDSFEVAKRMVAAGRAAGRVHMITQNYRFNPTPRTAHRLVAGRAMGEAALCVVGFYMPWATRAGTHYTTMPYPLITDMGVHHFDLVRYVLGREPQRVLAVCWNQSWGWHAGDASHLYHAEFEGGLRVTHHACGCSVGKKSPWNGEWRIEGSEGSLTWEDDHLFLTRSHPAEAARREEVPLDAMALTGQDAILAEFVAAVRERREPECSAADNLKSLAMVFAGIRSDQERRWVELDELLG
ncbi:MAG: Gfo/Idh/MocA family oxidoreductase [Armatimonadetes bacterium]|nr:Gfo/Idh/MocA family oxidoreductase [Armatimonadota bacterium]